MKKEETDTMEDTMMGTVWRTRRETTEDTVKVPGFGFLDRELWAGLEPLRRVRAQECILSLYLFAIFYIYLVFGSNHHSSDTLFLFSTQISS